jgi:hypothetical protein
VENRKKESGEAVDDGIQAQRLSKQDLKLPWISLELGLVK